MDKCEVYKNLLLLDYMPLNFLYKASQGVIDFTFKIYLGLFSKDNIQDNKSISKVLSDWHINWLDIGYKLNLWTLVGRSENYFCFCENVNKLKYL